MKYFVYKSDIKNISGIKTQEYTSLGEFEMSVPIRVGEYFSGKRIVKIDYVKNNTASIYVEGDVLR